MPTEVNFTLTVLTAWAFQSGWDTLKYRQRPIFTPMWWRKQTARTPISWAIFSWKKRKKRSTNVLLYLVNKQLFQFDSVEIKFTFDFFHIDIKCRFSNFICNRKCNFSFTFYFKCNCFIISTFFFISKCKFTFWFTLNL